MPASGRFLLDTNIVIALMAGEERVLSCLDEATEVFISAIVTGELFFGASKSGRPLKNAVKVERFAAERVIVPCDVHAAREYGRLKHYLRQKGCPHPENDIWIAAAAAAHNLTLATRDRHFREIDDLALSEW
jgi:tRNA(fMet)-specific endonuclease VapC